MIYMRRLPAFRRFWAVVRSRAAVPVVATLTLHVFAANAWAQGGGRAAGGDDKGLWQWGISAGLAVVICAAAFISPRRHQPKV